MRYRIELIQTTEHEGSRDGHWSWHLHEMPETDTATSAKGIDNSVSDCWSLEKAFNEAAQAVRRLHEKQ